jgi:hypothetical protein
MNMVAEKSAVPRDETGHGLPARPTLAVTEQVILL